MTWLGKCLKSPVSEETSTSSMVKVPNLVEICITAPLSYLLISLKKLSWTKPLLVICKILGLFVETFTGNDKYSVLNRKKLTQPIQMHLSHKQNLSCQFFCYIFEMQSEFWTFCKKRWPSQLMYFWNLGLQKTWLGKCWKSSVSKDPSTSNMVSGSKQCSNLHGSIFITFFNHCEENWVRKSCS